MKMKPLFATIVGSKLYGLSTDQSDTDFKGFGFPEMDELIGLANFEQKQYKNNIEDGPAKVEGSMYAIGKYVQLCMKGNPTVIEVAFADPIHHIYLNTVGEYVLDFIKANMLTKHLFKPYSAYHRAQMKKLQSMNRTGKRAEDVLKYGYDPKFASHAYRLATQCIMVMKEGTLNPTLEGEDRDIALALRAGDKYNKDEVLAVLEKVDKEMYVAYEASKLPERPNYNVVNNFLVDLHKGYIDWTVEGYNELVEESEFDKLVENL